LKIKKKILIPLALFAMFSMEYKQAFAAEMLYDHTKVTVFAGSETLYDGLLTNSFSSSTSGYGANFVDTLKIKKIVFVLGNPTYTLSNIGFKNSQTTNGLVLATNVQANTYQQDSLTYVEVTHKTQPYIFEGFSTSNGITNTDIREIQYYYTNDDSTPPAAISNLNYVFGDDNSVTYTYDLPSDSDFSHIEVYQDAQLIKDNHQLSSLKITGLLPESNYNFLFYAVDTSGNKSIVKSSTIQMPAGPDLIAPQNITNVKNVVSDDTIQFSYLLPIDSDFSHLQVYRNNELIAPNVQLASFVDEGLDYETSYTYSFKSVDTSGNISEGTTLTLQTMPYNDLTAPSAPTGLDVLIGNSSLALSWFSNPENDVQGYNIYVDGVKRNGAPVIGNSYSLTNLANANEYSIQISAVDTNGNESVLTVEKIAIPDGSKIPFFKLDNDLTDVVESTENWFSEMWLIVAFSAGIPLAFVVGNRIKSLFFA